LDLRPQHARKRPELAARRDPERLTRNRLPALEGKGEARAGSKRNAASRLPAPPPRTGAEISDSAPRPPLAARRMRAEGAAARPARRRAGAVLRPRRVGGGSA